jgi:hypothetical protein
MPVNWGLGLQQGPNAGEAFANSFQQGQEQNRQNTARNAMAVLVQDPNNQRALQALAQVDPQSAQQFQQQKLEMARQQIGQHYDSVLKGGQIVRQVQPKDQNGWNQVLMMAHQAGIPLDEVPQVWNEQTAQYAQQLSGLADAFKPQQENDVQNIPYQAGGGVLQYDKRTHQVHQLVVPNDGTQMAGAPVSQGPQPGHVEDGYRFKGGNPADPNSWEHVGGSMGAAPSSGFPR